MLNTKTLILSVVLFSLLVFGCRNRPSTLNYSSPNPVPDIEMVEDNIDSASDTIDNVADNVEDSADNIRDSSSDIRRRIPDIPNILRPYFEERVTDIDTETSLLFQNAVVLRTANDDLERALAHLAVVEDKAEVLTRSLKKASNDNEYLAEERDAAIAAKDDATQKMLRWLIIACTVGGGVSIALMFYGNFAIGGMLLAGCAATVTIAIAVEKYFDYIAIGGLVVLGLVGAYVVYKMYQKEKTIQEVVKTTEIAKRRLPAYERRRIFGYREEPGMAESGIQSAGTVREVDKVRKKFKKRWDHVSEDEDAKEMDEHDKILREERKAHMIIGD